MVYMHMACTHTRMNERFLLIPFLVRKFLPLEGPRKHTQPIVTQAPGRCLQWIFFVNRKAWGGGLGQWGPARVDIALVTAPSTTGAVGTSDFSRVEDWGRGA